MAAQSPKTIDFIYLDQITLQGFPTAKYGLELFVGDQEINLQKRPNRTWTPARRPLVDLTSKIRVEITMKSRPLPWSDEERTTEEVDLQPVFDGYWASSAQELTVSGDVIVGQHSGSLELQFSVNVKAEYLRSSLKELEGLLEEYSPLMNRSTERRLDMAIMYGAVFTAWNPFATAACKLAGVTIRLLKEQNKYDQIPPGLLDRLQRIMPLTEKVVYKTTREQTEILEEIIPRMFEVVQRVAKSSCEYVKRGRFARAVVGLVRPETIDELDGELTKVLEDFDRAMNAGALRPAGAPENSGGDKMDDTITPENHDITTLDPLLQRVYPLHPLHRQILQVVLQLEFQQLHDSPGYQQNLDQNFTNAQHSLSLLAPISRMPAEIQAEMLLLAIQSIGHSPTHLMQVCGSWYAVIESISRLWLSLKLGVWTDHEKVLSTLQRSGERPLDVEIDTTDDIKNINDSRQRYRALADTIPSMPRWKTLKILTSSAIKSNESINDEAWLVSQLSKPLSRLESFTILGQCPSSPFVDKLVSIISDSSMGTLRSIQVPCPSVISRIVGRLDYGIFHSLVTLKVQRKAVPQEGEIIQMDFLPHMKCLEVLELTSILIPNYPLSTTLPLVQTLQQLVLRATSIQWLFGRTLNILRSCTITSPRVEPSDHKEVDLPSCRELMYDGYPLTTLHHFLLPTITTLGLRINESGASQADGQLDWLRAGLVQGRFGMVNVLSIDLLRFSGTLLETLARLSLLQEFTLRMNNPTELSCRALRRLCAEPLVRSDKQEGVHWESWDKKMGEWQTSLWPMLESLRFEFRKWLPDPNQEDILPLFVAIAGTRTRLDVPLQRFEVLIGGGATDNPPLELVADSLAPLLAFSLNGTCNDLHPKALEATISSTMFKCMESRSIDTLTFFLQPPCRSALRKLRSLHLHFNTTPQDPIDVLPYFVCLKNLEAHGLRVPTYSLATDLRLVRTLKRLSLRHTSIQWMIGRRFIYLEECSIWNPGAESFPDGCMIKMPACRGMLFGDRTTKHLGLFYLPMLAKLALANPWFPDLPNHASQWIKGVEGISETIKVTSLQLEVSVCRDFIINVLQLQPGLEELVLRLWGSDSLTAVLIALSIDSNAQSFEEGCMEVDSSSRATVIGGSTTKATLPICPQLEILNLKLENIDYEGNRSKLLPFFKAISDSRRARGRPLRSFKISWQFGEREEHFVS